MIDLRFFTPLALGLCVSVTACSQIPTYQRPDSLPTASAWPHAPATDTSNTSLPTWQGFFVDPTLQRLIGQALNNNRDLRIAALNLEQAKAQLGLRAADQWPTLNLALGGNRTPTNTGSISSSYSTGVLFTAYELDFFGRVASLKEQALAQYLATEAGQKNVQLGLISSVAQNWLALLADAEQCEVARHTLQSREQSLQLIRLRFEQGLSAELDLRQAESLRENARLALAQWQRQRALDENALTLLLGQPLSDALSTWPRLGQVELPRLQAGLPSQLLNRRPDILQAEQQLKAAHANIGAARAAFFPRIALTAGVGSASGELSGLLQSGSWGFTLKPEALLPIFDAGRNQTNLQLAETGRTLAWAQYEKAIQTAFREVADALASRDSLQEQWQALQAQSQADKRRLELATLRYQHGNTGQLEWLDAQRTDYTSQQALLQTQLAYWQTQIALYKALGGDSAVSPSH